MAWKDLPSRPNILVIITDQQRHLQHWPAGWVEQNLPAMTRLLRNGISFNNAFAAACECSPSRGTFVTSTFDNTNRIFTTAPQQNLPLPPGLPNLATVLAAAGYQVFWKGKWHLFAQPSNTLEPYGFTGWDPPDAGTTLGPTLLGGGIQDNDGRFVRDAIAFLQSYTSNQPFCLIVSLVNPHDVHVYTQNWAQPSVAYPGTIPDLGVGLPANQEDPLTDKPRAQGLFRANLDRNPSFRLNSPLTPAGYVNFYAYLHTVVDAQILALLGALDAAKLTDGTLIVRMGDHGEMGMSHGLREKMYVAYDEAIHVPFIFSNPLAFPQPVETDSFASLLDLVPTLASVAGATPPPGLMGQDLTPVLADPSTSVQDEVLYSYDDSFGLNDSQVATHIRALRTENWMYSVYFSESNPANVPVEFELYNLGTDPGQLTNLLSPQYFQPEILPQWIALNSELWELAGRLGSTPPGFQPPAAGDLTVALLEAAAKPVAPEAVGTLVLEGK